MVENQRSYFYIEFAFILLYNIKKSTRRTGLIPRLVIFYVYPMRRKTGPANREDDVDDDDGVKKVGNKTSKSEMSNADGLELVLK